MIDTADRILHRPTGIHYQVACVHEEFLYTLGHPALKLLVDACALIERASPQERADVLTALAQCSSNTHRPQCARRKIMAAAQMLVD